MDQKNTVGAGVTVGEKTKHKNEKIIKFATDKLDDEICLEGKKNV